MKHKRFKILFITTIAIIIFALIGNVLISFAASSAELKQQQQQNEKEMKNAEKEQQEMRNKMTAIQREVEDLNTKIAGYENEIMDLTQQIQDTENNINAMEIELEKTQKNLEEKERLLEKRLVITYKKGDTTYLDVLLSSESLIDLLSSYYYMERLAESDTRLIETIKETKKQIEETKAALEASKLSLEDAKKAQELKKQSLDIVKKEKKVKYNELSAEEQALQAKIDEMRAEDSKIRAAIDKALKEEEERRKQQEANGQAPTSNPGGYIRPVPGSYNAITTGLYYSWGGYHGAVDFGSPGINGQPVYAAKSGTVILTQSLSYSYGNYILIDHHDGLFTLYAHGQQGSISVSQGQKVKQGQQIMRVGSTGNSSGPHLHFEIRTSPGGYANRVDPRKYLP